MLLANSDDLPERESAHLDLFEQQRVRGLLVSPIGNVFDRLERLRTHGIITVLVDRVADGRPFSSVSVDDVAGGHLAVTHLIEQGCRRIAFIGGPVTIRQVADRLLGANKAVAEHDDVELEVIAQGRADRAARPGRGRLDRPTARSAGDPDGVFCANDLLAVGALQSSRC